MVPVYSAVHGLRLLEPHEPLYERQRVYVAHGIVVIRPYTLFNVKVANFAEETVVLVANQTVRRALEAYIPSRILAVNLDVDPELSALPEEGGPRELESATLAEAYLNHLTGDQQSQV